MLHSIYCIPLTHCSGNVRKMLCKKGSANYMNNLLVKIVSNILCNNEYGWQAVAIAHQEQSKEEALRDSSDLKKHWIKKLYKNVT